MKMGSHGDDPSSGLVAENVPPLLFKMLPLSCIHTKQIECGSTQSENASFKCELQPRPWGPVTLFSIESDSPIRSALLFQTAVTLAAAGDSVVYITSAPLQTLPPGVHGMPVPASEYMHRVRFLYLPTAAAVLNYLASLHMSNNTSGGGGGRLPDAFLLDAPVVTSAPAAAAAAAAGSTPGKSPARGGGSSLTVLARLRAALEEAALTSASSRGADGRCAALMVSEPLGARPDRPADPRTGRLLVTAPDTLQLVCGRLSCRVEVMQNCLCLRRVAVAP